MPSKAAIADAVPLGIRATAATTGAADTFAAPNDPIVAARHR